MEELARTRSHPTADELYDAVRRRLPRISLATVYRNLDLLCQNGLVGRLEGNGGRARFDGDLSDHCHARCVGCGCVVDMPDPPPAFDATATRGPEGFEIVDRRVEFLGYCPECKLEGVSAQAGYG